jgi:hypothetical protein
MSHSSNQADSEDLTGLAGWVYTDLMLALMVIFLATISFVPDYLQPSSKIHSPNFAYSKVIADSLDLIYESFDMSQINSDVARFKSTSNIPQDADIVYAQFVGGYTSSESPSMAISRALRFSQEIDSSDKGFLKNAATTLSSSNVLKQNQVIVRLTFAVVSKIDK